MKTFPFNLLMAWIRPYHGLRMNCQFCAKLAAYQFYPHINTLDQRGFFDLDAEWDKCIRSQMMGVYQSTPQYLCKACMLRRAGILLMGLGPEGERRITELHERAQAYGFGLAVVSTIRYAKHEGDTWATTVPNGSGMTIKDVGAFINTYEVSEA